MPPCGGKSFRAHQIDEQITGKAASPKLDLGENCEFSAM